MLFYISDIHVQIGKTKLPSVKSYIKKVIGKSYIESTGGEPSNTIIINGDIAEDNKIILASLSVFKEYFENVIYVLGNHEYYLINDKHFSSVDKIDELKQDIKERGVILLDKDIVEIDGIRIGGANMWYPLNDTNIDKWYDISNDSEYILGLNIDKEHQDSVKWYNKAVKQVDIMVTHIPVVRTDSHKEFNNDDFYLAKMEDYAPINIFGHTHEITNFKKDGSVFLTNGVNFVGDKIDSVGLLKGLSIK